ncbi:MAG TPA: nucleoside diphosphate kinase regulator [Croceibacterium sp.]
MHAQPAAPSRPPITLTEAEGDTLFNLACAARDAAPNSASLLLEELSRAEFCAPGSLPADVVTMHSRVVFRDEGTGEEHAVELVFPRAADVALGRVSVLTPVGAALIGLRRGSAIDWPNRLGAVRRLRIVEVIQPERDG